MRIAIAGSTGGIGKAIVKELTAFDEVSGWNVGHKIVEINRDETEAPDCDVLILVSGIGRFGPLESIEEGDIEQMRWVNLERHILLVKSIINKWKVRKHGHIVFIGSNSSYVGIDGNSVYSATKAGLLAFARSIQAEISKLGIKVTTISPGTVNTNFWQEAGRDNRVYGYIEPEEVARAVRFCIDLPSVVTEMVILPVIK